jgi:SAM-dependent methyltransferase
VTPPVSEQLAATAAAFDSVAPTYDGPQGNNPLIQRMRELVWDRVNGLLAGPSTLIDIGCGTGIDAQYFAQRGHHVYATDWSPEMVHRAGARATEGAGTITAARVGAQELHLLNAPAASVDLSYSNFGPLNCVPDLAETARSLAELTRPGGYALFTVIGRYCPWEVAHYVRKRRWTRAKVRFQRDSTPVGMNGHTIWTRYFSPREFVREWVGDGSQWEVEYYESLSLFVPPPYLDAVAERHPQLFGRLVSLDQTTARWPIVRDMGDHFLLVMRRR